ncbi:Autophagy protein 22 [Tulasnella sp. 424]|nr:Autophagy protein 22 [Tulasnella sp. 424]KAG8968666.1 Autophagy protein 22 [Tulasnella sp. 425]
MAIDGGSEPGSEARCVVKIGWLWVDSASFSLYVYSASVAIQALTVISMGGVADHPPHRKLVLLGFAAIGSLSATLFLPLSSTSPLWPASALLAILANVSFGASIVALNAYLPSLARSAPEVVAAKTEAERLRSESHHHQADGAAVVDEEAKKAVEKYHTLLSRTTSRISSQGIAIGYAAGITLLLLALVPVTLLHGSTFSLRLAIGMSGVWWAFFTVPSWLWLPGGSGVGGKETGAGDREEEQGLLADADSISESTATPPAEGEWTVWAEIVKSWRRLGQMLHPSEIRKLRNTFWFLSAWFLLSDGFTTITSTAILFAKTTLHMPATSLVLIGAITPLSGIIGSLAWPKLQRKLGWSNLRALVALVLVAAVIPLYGCLGFVPWLKGAKFGGLTTKGEMWALAVYFGSVYGAFQSYARSVFAELIPPGEEARWYGLYSITDKSSSFFGPLVVGLIADATGNIRYAFFFLFFMLLVPVPILLGAVDVERGREDAARYSEAKDAASR